MWTIIGAILGYYFFSRMLILFYYSFLGIDIQNYITGKEATHRDDENVLPIAFPVVGELHLIYVLICFLIYYPFYFSGHLGGLAKQKMETYQKNTTEQLERRKQYLDKLSKYGLTQKDIPKYIKEPKALEDYLNAWKITNQ